MTQHTPLRLLAAGAAAAVATTALVGAPAAAAPSRAPQVQTVAVGDKPVDVAVSQSLGKAFVANSGSVSVVSLLTQRTLTEFRTRDEGSNGIALMQGNRLGYVTSLDDTGVVVFDTETYEVVERVAIGDGAVDVVKVNTPKGQRAYVATRSTNELVAIRTSTGKVVQRVALPDQAQTLTAGPGGKTVWAGSVEDGRIWVVDTTKGRIRNTIKVTRSGPVTAIAFAPGSKRAWVVGLGGVSVVDTSSGKTTKFITAPRLFTDEGPNVEAVALTPSGRYALVLDSGFPEIPRQGEVAEVDTKTYKVVRHVTTGVTPARITIDRARDTAYVPDFGDDTLSYFSTPR